ncbi:hypothetical protein RJT34_20697 [Clitoria ternatea]|uniref:Uncharacterized protein n=1 Tax=Clitoria ternatea TaxID=43366 RepID=A0AAN9ITA0_CLITE
MPRGATGSGHNGALTLSSAPFQGTWAWSATEDVSPDYNLEAKGNKFSWRAFPCSLVVTKGILAQLAFKDSMVHEIPQFTPSIAFRYVLHQCKSQDICCQESFIMIRLGSPCKITVSGSTGGRMPTLQFLDT